VVFLTVQNKTLSVFFANIFFSEHIIDICHHDMLQFTKIKGSSSRFGVAAFVMSALPGPASEQDFYCPGNRGLFLSPFFRTPTGEAGKM
jgi:hypothetical protein